MSISLPLLWLASLVVVLSVALYGGLEGPGGINLFETIMYLVTLLASACDILSADALELRDRTPGLVVKRIGRTKSYSTIAGFYFICLKFGGGSLHFVKWLCPMLELKNIMAYYLELPKIKTD